MSAGTAVSPVRAMKAASKIQELVTALRPLAAKSGKSFAKYTIPEGTGKEAEKTGSAVVDGDELVAAADVSEALANVSKPIGKDDAKAAIKQLLNEFNAAWKIKPEVQQSWINIMAMRIRCIDAKTSEVMRRAKPPAYIEQIPWIVALRKAARCPAPASSPTPAPDATAGATTAPAEVREPSPFVAAAASYAVAGATPVPQAVPETEMFYGYSERLNIGIRKIANDNTDPGEYCH